MFNPETYCPKQEPVVQWFLCLLLFVTHYLMYYSLGPSLFLWIVSVTSFIYFGTFYSLLYGMNSGSLLKAVWWPVVVLLVCLMFDEWLSPFLYIKTIIVSRTLYLHTESDYPKSAKHTKLGWSGNNPFHMFA